jgi:hypothetical protein
MEKLYEHEYGNEIKGGNLGFQMREERGMRKGLRFLPITDCIFYPPIYIQLCIQKIQKIKVLHTSLYIYTISPHN